MEKPKLQMMVVKRIYPKKFVTSWLHRFISSSIVQNLAQEWRDRVFDFATASGCLRSAFAFIPLRFLSTKIPLSQKSYDPAHKKTDISFWNNLLSLCLAIVQIPANFLRILHSISEIDSRPPESLRRHFLQLLKLTLRRIQATRTANPSVSSPFKNENEQNLLLSLPRKTAIHLVEIPQFVHPLS
jgi:hypothetical protein